MSTAFVRSGGGSLGAVQVGMLAALHDHGIEPDVLIGTSVGALIAAYLAAAGFSATSISDLDGIWRGLRRGDVFRRHRRSQLRPTRSRCCSNSG